jgi:hypothetical protein
MGERRCGDPQRAVDPSRRRRPAGARCRRRRAPRAGESSGTRYLAAIDGMSVDDPPEEGFVRGRLPASDAALAFECPRDFPAVQRPGRRAGRRRDRSLLYFSCKSGTCRAGSTTGCATAAADADRHPGDRDRRREAAIGARPRGSDTGLGQVALRHDPPARRHLLFQLAERGPDRDRRIDVLVERRAASAPCPTRRRGAQALSPARDPPAASAARSRRACPIATSRWSGC